MSVHKDATAHLLALREDIPWDWFTFACELALGATDDSLSSADLNKLVSLFCHKESYTARSATSPPTPAAPSQASPATASHLKELTAFTNFKKLASTLHVTFDKRITLVFGTNGSGKSSVCQAVKLLASPMPPESPLNNVYGSLHSNPSFSYRFSPDAATSNWSETDGFGAFSSRIRYFDSTIALRHINDELHPETIIEVAPFRLEVFDFCRSFVTKLRDKLLAMIEGIGKTIDMDAAVIASAFTDASDQYKTAITDLSSRSHAALEKELATFTPITSDDTKEHEDAAQALARLAEASTEQGVKVLRSEATSLRRLQSSIASFVALCQKASPDSYKSLVKERMVKTTTQKALASDILPEGTTLDHFKAFLDASGEVFAFPGESGDPCPFCRRPLEGESLDLVRKYHDFLVSTLQQEIGTLTQQIEEAATNLESVRDFFLELDDDISSFFPDEEREPLLRQIDDVRRSIPNPLPRNEEPLFGNAGSHLSLEATAKRIGEEADKRDEAIRSVTSGSTERQQEIDRLTAITHKYAYRKTFGEQVAALERINAKCKARQALQSLVDKSDFPTILRRMTIAGKEAHAELVVAEFEKTLNDEYAALSGRSLADFGIRLKPRGEQQSVAVETQIGDTPIRRVLSEGEQKVHALALFFCEAIAQPTDAFIFDDPSTSFDYNHVSFFVERLRELVRRFPDSQFIIFTHNWDLFVQIQVIFNKARLTHNMEVKVMENCALVEEYSEKVDELKQQVADMLALPGDFDSGQKEKISGLMRRLLESIVNKYVFNGQRHQFKQRRQSVSGFDEFVRLVPLTQQEAQKLSDLYGHLSVPEHDDPRNFYVSRNKTSFQTWFNDLCGIEDDLISRRP
jgi:energy-coupling factor transporter ATP-binding protein EcfA2